MMTGLIVLAVLAGEPPSQAAALLDVATDYGAPQLPKPFPTKAWLGLCRAGSGFVVREVGVRVVPVKSSWDHPGATTSRQVRVKECRKAKAVFTGVPVVKGPVKSAQVDGKKVVMGSSVLTFEVVVQEHASTKLYVIEGGRRMLLSEQPDGGPIDFRVRWAGDLDGDGLPDLLIEEDDEGTLLSLFLSSVEKKDAVWNVTASTFHGGS